MSLFFLYMQWKLMESSVALDAIDFLCKEKN